MNIIILLLKSGNERSDVKLKWENNALKAVIELVEHDSRIRILITQSRSSPPHNVLLWVSSSFKKMTLFFLYKRVS